MTMRNQGRTDDTPTETGPGSAHLGRPNTNNHPWIHTATFATAGDPTSECNLACNNAVRGRRRGQMVLCMLLRGDLMAARALQKRANEPTGNLGKMYRRLKHDCRPEHVHENGANEPNGNLGKMYRAFDGGLRSWWAAYAKRANEPNGGLGSFYRLAHDPITTGLARPTKRANEPNGSLVKINRSSCRAPRRILILSGDRANEPNGNLDGFCRLSGRGSGQSFVPAEGRANEPNGNLGKIHRISWSTHQPWFVGRKQRNKAIRAVAERPCGCSCVHPVATEMCLGLAESRSTGGPGIAIRALGRGSRDRFRSGCGRTSGRGSGPRREGRRRV